MSMCWKKGKKTGPQGTAVFTHRQIKNAALGFVSCSATTCLFSTCQALGSVPILKNSSGSGSSKPTWRATPLCLTGACSEEPPPCHRTLRGVLLVSGWPACIAAIPGDPAAGITWASGSTSRLHSANCFSMRPFWVMLYPGNTVPSNYWELTDFLG